MKKRQDTHKEIKLFAGYLGGEFSRFGVYVNSFVVGAVINLFTTGGVFASVVPYIVPLLVQTFSRASLRFVNRFKERLMELPMERETPVFIMDEYGDIVLAGGHTKETFQNFNIVNIKDFIGESGFHQILGLLNNPNQESIEVYSNRSKKWYEVRAKLKNLGDSSNILIWFDDITERKILDSRIFSMLSFSDHMIANLDTFIRNKDAIERLAHLIIDTGYQGVFIAKNDGAGRMEGFAFKKEEGKLVQSDLIVISKNDVPPFQLSRQHSRMIIGDVRNYASPKAFHKEFQFNHHVAAFLGFHIDNFINYHEGGFTIKAFNKHGHLSKYDSMLLETLVNHTRSVVLLIDLAEKNDEQFLQKVFGLCAAAEYSDEITGKHILRINEYARLIARHLGCADDFVHTIGQVAALHDIGKVAIPEFIKMGRLYTQEESAQMHMHTIYGAKIINTMIDHGKESDHRLNMAYNIALHHHQRWNGSGYPGLKQKGTPIEPTSEDYKLYLELTPLQEEEIPLEALITGLADAYDALRSNRPYKEGLSHRETVDLLAYDDNAASSGTQRFGPRIWSVFEEHHQEFDTIFNRLQ